MSIAVHRSASSRHLVLRVSAGDIVPNALATMLRDEQVACGWLRGSGVLADVDLRAYDAEIGALGGPRRIVGPVQALVIEGSIGLSGGEPSLSLRALLARQADFGLQTLCGEIESARAVALEMFVTALDDLALERALDETAGVWLLGTASAQPSEARERPAASPAWSAALEASDRADRHPRRRAPQLSSPQTSAPIPARLPRPGGEVEAHAPFPEPGDAVEHFAFGHCDVLKSDGDRLHVKLHKDSRVREIALAMLRVSRLPDLDDGRRRFKLERRM